MSENSKPQKKDVYDIVIEPIIKQLEQGIIPWRKHWTEAGLPQSLVTKRPYRGINVWLLNLRGFSHNVFITPKQLKELGGAVKEGEQGTPITFWNWQDVTSEDGRETKSVPFLRYYLVYNIAQCEGIPEESIPALPLKEVNPIKQCEAIISEMPEKPSIKNKEKKAFYNPLLDVINVPKMDSFESSESYYQTLFHQLVHSTGHFSRLYRKEIWQMAEYGANPYSVEELIAEMGACYLQCVCGFTGNSQAKDNELEVEGWLRTLKGKTQMAIYASSKAQQAVDYILNLSAAKEKGQEPTVESVAEKGEVPA